MRKVNIDLDKYMVYENDDGDLFAAVNIDQCVIMDNYYRSYDHFKSAPDEITIEGYRIVPDKAPNSFTIELKRKTLFRVNELRGTWIEKRG